MNIYDISPEICTGCGACMNCCPVDAIQMQLDKEGFLQPVINHDVCCECGKCSDICPVTTNNTADKTTGFPICLAAWSKNDQIRSESSSGGVFSHLAMTVLKQGGAVAGAGYRQDHLVEHIIIHTCEEIADLRQSKYVQSEINYVFRQIEKELLTGAPFLFVGTPCQCAGLSAYLGKEYSNLYLCDFICRGVNSPMVYLNYLKQLKEKYNSEITHIQFRNKTFGWNNFSTKIVFENQQEYIADRESDPFTLGFVKTKLSFYMRQSCYDCRFKGVSRPVDFTLGDFWGIKLDADKIKNGVSALIIHTDKAQKLMENIYPEIYCEKHHISEITSGNPCISNSVSLDKDKRSLFFDMIKKESFSDCINYFRK